MRYKGNIMLSMDWRRSRRAMSCPKETGVGLTPENEKSPPAKAGDNETKPVPDCAGNIGTGNDSGCLLAKVPLVMFELMVCKGTADGGGNTCAIECILLTGNETDGAEACNGKRLALPN